MGQALYTLYCYSFIEVLVCDSTLVVTKVFCYITFVQFLVLYVQSDSCCMLQGRESQIRIVLNKADSLEFHELMRVYGALFWSLSPLINVTEPPRVYIGSFRHVPFLGQTIHHDLFLQEEISLLQDLHDVAASAIEMKLALIRQHAIRVLVHAELVSEFVNAFNRARGIFTDANAVRADIITNPERYVQCVHSYI